MGAKNLKAIGCRGTGAVKVACTGKQLLAQIAYHTGLVGGTSGGMVPNLPHPWAEFSGGGDWTSGKGVWWGGADPAISTGDTDPHNVHTYGFRGPGNRSGWNANERQMTWLVRSNACFGCPVPCKAALHVPEMDTKYGYGDRPCNECGGLSTTRDYYGFNPGAEPMFLGSVLADDYGLGDDYHILTGDLCYYYTQPSVADPTISIMKKALRDRTGSDAEYNSIPWAKRTAGDPEFIRDLLRRFAFREGELGYAFGLGSYEMAKRWNAPPLSQMLQDRSYGKAVAWNETTWFAPHHFEGNQVGYILNSMYNRDPCMHEQTHFNAFTTAIDKRVMAAVGYVASEDAVDSADQMTPINDAKIRLAVRMSADGVLHNSLCTCNRGSSPWQSPLKERGYIGDSSLDATEYSMVTGDVQTELEFMNTGLRIFNLLRASTIRSMGTKNMRVGHDVFPESGFNHKDWKTKKPFEPGSQRMDHADMDKALTMYYAAMGWDQDGAPTRATYERLGLKSVADELETAGLL
jgi:aldehyde:ferredoxin oxidoreductase